MNLIFNKSDLVSVVRCKDCYYNLSNHIPGGDSCSKYVDLPIFNNFYCASGVRYDVFVSNGGKYE